MVTTKEKPVANAQKIMIKESNHMDTKKLSNHKDNKKGIKDKESIIQSEKK